MAELTKLGRYQLKRVLGRGAMGVVYEGLDPSLHRRVAVKTILKNAAIDEETGRAYGARFTLEAKAAARLNHPNIVQVYDFSIEGEVAYLVMEFIEGRELRSFFEAGERFELAEAVRIMAELLDALDFAHEAGVIHRDVKPANVMLDARRRAKLADFGVARLQDSERSAAGTMVGTPAFMSPEQISGGKIDRRTDIFSAGVVLYQLLTGEQPFTGEGAWTVAKKIMQDEPPAPSSLVKSVAPAFDAIVARALAKRPADRYASAGDFAAALQSALAAAPAAARSGAAARKTAPQASETELEFWRAIQNSTDAAEFEFYLEQFPEGTYAQLARHKIAKLNAPAAAARPAVDDTARLEAEALEKRRQAEERGRLEAEAQAQREAEERTRREAEEKARRETDEKAKREAEDKARREALEKVKREAEEKARREAAAKAKREAEERARRETEEKIRQAQALARLKAQEESAGKAKANTPAAESQPEKAKSMVVPAAIAAVVVIGGVAAYLFAGRAPAPAPVAETAPPKPAAAPTPAVDLEKIRRETEERLRKEYAEKAASERAALEKSLADKIAAEAAAAKKVAEAKSAAEKAAAEKAVAAAAVARAAAEKAAAEKAAAQRANEEKAAAQRAAAERAAAEKAAAEKAATERAATDRAAAETAAAEKRAAAKPAADSHEAKLEAFMQRVGRDKVRKEEPPEDAVATPASWTTENVVYVNDGSCGSGAIKEVTDVISSMGLGGRRSRRARCVSLTDGKPTAAAKPAVPRPATPTPAAPRPTAAPAPAARGDHQAMLERFIQRVGSNKVLKEEPPLPLNSFYASPLQPGEIVYVNDGSCGSGRIKEITGIATSMGASTRSLSWPTRCIPLE